MACVSTGYKAIGDWCPKKKEKKTYCCVTILSSKRLFSFILSPDFKLSGCLSKHLIRIQVLCKHVVISKKWIKIWEYIWPLHPGLPWGSVYTDPSLLAYLNDFYESLSNLLNNSLGRNKFSYPSFPHIWVLICSGQW